MIRCEKINIERVNILGVGVSVLNLESAREALTDGVNKPGFQGYVTITGVHGVVESQSDEELKKIHNRSYLSTPDGMPMVWLGKLQGYTEMDRVYGPELMLDVMLDTSQAEKSYKHYFFGGNEGVAERLSEKLTNRYPGLKVVGTMCPPFRKFTKEEEQALYNELLELKPHYFWVGLSTPKQEKFMHEFLDKYSELTKGWEHGLIMLGVGAAFDFHSGSTKQAPYWIQRSGFEWLYRIFQDPKRLLRRYLIANSKFCLSIVPQLLGFKKYKLKC